MRSRFCYLTLTTLLLIDSSAFCADFLTSGGSARSTAEGGIYLPDSDNVMDAMAINPAGLALIGAPRLDITLEGALATGQFVNAANSGNSAGHLNSIGGIPYGAFGTPLGSGRVTRRFSFGVAAMPQLLSSAKWKYTDAPGGAGSVSYGPLHSDSAITAVRAAVGMGVYLGPRVQLGATFGSTYNTNTLETAYVFQTYQPLAGLKTLLDLHTNGYGFNGSVGALVRASKKVQFGVTYQTRTTIQSTGTAAGNAGVQFAAIGLGAAQPDFRYNAQVNNVLPQSVTANAVWQVTSKLRLAGQVDWIDWSSAFTSLPVILTHGSNPDINGLLGTNAITDSIPLAWHDQTVARVGVERHWLENIVLRAGYAHANSPVPASTLSPLTAAITRDTFSAGAGYAARRWRFDLAYTIDPQASQSVGTSALKSGEFNDSTVKVQTQAIILTTSFRL